MSRKRSRKFDSHNISAINTMKSLISPEICKDIVYHNRWRECGYPACILSYNLPNRDVVIMKFTSVSRDDSIIRYHEIRWWVSLYIGPRKNQDINMDGLQTGRCGMHGLVVAKQMLLVFILIFLQPGQTLFVGGADGRRFRIYRHHLGKLGFKETRFDNEQTMMFTCPLTAKFPHINKDLILYE